jgi:hypothetical protein
MTQLSGSITTYVGFSDNIDEKFADLTGSGSLKIENQNLKTQKMYYVIIRGDTNSTFKLLVTQSRTIISLSDGVPQTITYADNEDITKNILMHLPSGD